MKELTQRQQEILTFISDYINTHTYPPTIREIADYFSFSVKGAHDHVAALKKKGCIKGDKRPRTIELIGIEETESADFIEIPILGNVAAGQPILGEENWDGSIKLHPSMLKDRGDYFALKVRGDSMEGVGIMDGDTAVVEIRDTVRNSEIAVVQLDERVTLKRFFFEGSRVRLQPENPRYLPIYSSQDIRILGRLATIIRSY